MNENIYQNMSDLEQTHWWFLNQKNAITRFLKRHLAQSTNKLVLDAGCGTGRFLDCLQQYGSVVGIEKNSTWAGHCKERGYKTVITATIEDKTFSKECFDIIGCFDVLEHVQRDRDALHHFSNMLKPGGMLFLSIPAGEAFFCRNELQYGHYRRYNLASIKTKLVESGFQFQQHAFFNFFLLPPIVLIRKTLDWFNIDTVDEIKVNPVINRLLALIVTMELPLLNRFSWPYGLSLLVSAKKIEEKKKIG
jgi:SAM-dependent methyltransferase